MIRIYNPLMGSRIKWWEKFILLFIREREFIDTQDTEDGMNIVLYYKIWKGRIYITDIINHFTWDVVLQKASEISKPHR